MKNMFVVDFVEKTVYGTDNMLKKAGKIGTPEYYALCELMERHPDFAIAKKAVSKNEGKKTYRNLTFEKMQEYILTQPNSEKNLQIFDAVKRVAKAKGSMYPLTKKWFLDKFKDYKDSVTEEETLSALANADAGEAA